MMMCSIDLFLRLVLFLLLSLCVIQFFSQREAFHPWNKYGTVAIKYMPSRSTGTTRLEYDYVKKKFPYKERPESEQHYMQPVAPVTTRQISNYNLI